MPVSEVMIERISIDLLKWASTVTEKPRDKPLILRDFFHAKGIPARTCSKWLNAHPKFKECYEEAKLMIASHREKGGLFKEYDVNMVKARQHAYDPDWKKDEEWRAELKQKTEEHKDITFNIRTVPSSPLVPEKEKNEE